MTQSGGPGGAQPAKRLRTRRPSVVAARRGSEVWTVVGLTVVVLFIAGLVAYFLTTTKASTSPAFAPADPPPGVQSFAPLSRDHVTADVTYPQLPPVGGAHNPRWLTCGSYPDPVPNENAVHSLEHGAVWITYRPDLAASEVAILRGAVRNQPYTVLSPYPGLPAPVVASGWGVQLRLPAASDPRLAQFIGFYQRGPQTPEPGAPCAGGVGHPLP